MRIFTLVLYLIVSSIKLSAQELPNQGKYALNDVELILLGDDGKVLEKKVVGSQDNEKYALMDKAEKRVLDKLGLKSKAESKGNRDLAQKYYQEYAKILKYNKLDPKYLEFRNDKATLEKKISIGYSETKSGGIKEQISRTPVISKSQTSAVISENKLSIYEGISAPDGEGTIKYYGANGEVAWEHSFGGKRAVTAAHLSKDGGVIGVIDMCEANCTSFLEQGIPIRRFNLFDKNGKELITYPPTPGGCDFDTSNFWISLAGDYAIISCLDRSFAFNVQKREIAKLPYRIDVLKDKMDSEIRSGDNIKARTTSSKEIVNSADLNLSKLPWEKL